MRDLPRAARTILLKGRNRKATLQKRCAVRHSNLQQRLIMMRGFRRANLPTKATHFLRDATKGKEKADVQPVLTCFLQRFSEEMS